MDATLDPGDAVSLAKDSNSDDDHEEDEVEHGNFRRSRNDRPENQRGGDWNPDHQFHVEDSDKASSQSKLL